MDERLSKNLGTSTASCEQVSLEQCGVGEHTISKKARAVMQREGGSEAATQARLIELGGHAVETTVGQFSPQSSPIESSLAKSPPSEIASLSLQGTPSLKRARDLVAQREQQIDRSKISARGRAQKAPQKVGKNVVDKATLRTERRIARLDRTTPYDRILSFFAALFIRLESALVARLPLLNSVKLPRRKGSLRTVPILESDRDQALEELTKSSRLKRLRKIIHSLAPSAN